LSPWLFSTWSHGLLKKRGGYFRECGSGVSEIEPCGLSQREGSWFDSRSEISSLPVPGPGPLLVGFGKVQLLPSSFVWLRDGEPPPLG